MEILKSEQIVEILNNRGVIYRNPIIIAIRRLNVGEGLRVLKNEWTIKTPLNVFVGNYRLRLGMGIAVRSLADGWVIIRTK